jgi:thiamine kinase-like enzyme
MSSPADRQGRRLAAALARVPALSDAEITDVTYLGGLTNRNYRVRFADGSVVVRLPGRAAGALIDRAAERHNAAIAAAASLAPELVFFDERDGLAVTSDLGGAPLDPATVATDAAVRDDVARTLRRLHVLGPAFRGCFDPVTLIDRHAAVLPEGTLPRGFEVTLQEAAGAWRVLQDAAPSAVPCHNDPWPANFVDADGDGLYLVDWEYSAMGDPAWDLAHLIVEAGLGPDEEHHLVACYEPDPPRALRDRVVAWQPLTDLVWSLWGFVEATDAGSGQITKEYALDRLDRYQRLFDSARVRDAVARLRG